MVGVQDFIVCDITPEVQLAAIDYAGRSIHFTYNRMGYGVIGSRLIRIGVGIAIEKAFEGYLNRQQVAFDILGRTHWREIDVAEFVIHNRRIDIKGYHVYPTANRNFPEWFLETEGLVPAGQLRRRDAPDAYMQAFFVSPQHNESATHYYINIFPRSWCNRWREARPVTVSVDRVQSEPISITLFGEGAQVLGRPNNLHGDVRETILIDSGQTTVTSKTDFVSLQYAAIERLPDSDISIQIREDGIHLFRKHDWLDMWLENPRVYFTAWGSKADYLNGEFLPRGSLTKVYTGGTKTANYSVLIRNLRPISELI